MEIKNPQFRAVEVEEKDVIRFPNGLPGFEGLTRFVVIEDDESAPICWFVPVDDQDIAFAVVDPKLFFPDYHVILPKPDQETLHLSNEEDARVLVIVTVSSHPAEMTANLMAPVVINAKEGIGKQVVLSESGYSTRKPLLDLATCGK